MTKILKNPDIQMPQPMHGASQNPHSNSILFRHVRNWLQDQKNIGLIPDLWQGAVTAISLDLKKRHVALLFAIDKQDGRDFNRSYFEVIAVPSIILHDSSGLENRTPKDLKDWKKLNAADQQHLGTMALDALGLYYNHIFNPRRVWAQRPPIELVL